MIVTFGTITTSSNYVAEKFFKIAKRDRFGLERTVVKCTKKCLDIIYV